MIVRRVTQVTLTRHPDAREEPWTVSWTEGRNNKAEHLVKHHFTERAARRHVQGLLDMRAAGLSVDAVYTEDLQLE